MDKRNLKTAGMILLVAAMASILAWAAEPASLFKTSSTTDPWIIGIANDGQSFGKVKIFDTKPAYDEDGELKDTPKMLKQLRNPGETCVLPRIGATYWIIFYPKYGLLNLTPIFYKGKDPTLGARFNVKKIILPGTGSSGSLKLEVKLTGNKTYDFTLPNVDNFESYDGDPAQTTDPAPVFLLK